MQSLSLLETDPKKVQDLRENIKLKLKCTFGPSFSNTILVTQGAVMEQTTVAANDVPAAVKDLKNVRLMHNVMFGSIQFALYVSTNRSLNNLTFLCTSNFENGSAGD